MNKSAPRPLTIAAILVFLASVIGLMAYLWLAFGGGLPLQPQGYRMNIPFREGAQLVPGSDVRIAGVDVGTVKRVHRRGGAGVAEVELGSEYAPRPRGTRATVRQKTLLGEIYIELTPGTATAPKIADGGTVAPARVAQAVELDEVFRTFDPETRNDFSRWLTEQGTAFRQQAPALSAAVAQLAPLARSSGDTLRVLDQQSRDTRALVRGGAQVFGALSQRRGQLRRLVRTSDRAFGATAARNRELSETIVALPTFLRETRRTVNRAGRFAQDHDPLMRQLIPAADALSPAATELQRVAPDFRVLMAGLGPLSENARTGFPALQRALDDSVPWLRRLRPYLGNLIPVIDYAARYRREIAGSIATLAAATQATTPPSGGGRSLHYLRAALPVSPESLAAYPRRVATSRGNAYPAPGAAAKLAGGLEVFDKQSCGKGALPSLSSAIPEETRAIIEAYYYPQSPDTAAPPCKAQAALGRALTGEGGTYPRLRPLR